MHLCAYGSGRVAVMIWREKRILLIILGVLLAANTIFFFTYRVRYEKRLQDLNDRLAQSEAKLGQARVEHVAAERRVTAYHRAERDVRDIYEKQWSTEAARLSALIVEVKRLTAARGYVPPRSTTGRGWPCSGSRWKGRCTKPGRRPATAGSSATWRRSQRPSTISATA